jgi:peptide/nickel transport system permease protein
MSLVRNITWLVGRNLVGFVAVALLIVLLAFLPLSMTIRAGVQDTFYFHGAAYWQGCLTYVGNLFHGSLGTLPGNPWMRQNPEAVTHFIGKLVDRSTIVLIPAIVLGAVFGVLLGASTFFLPGWLRRFFSTSNQLIFSMPDLMIIILLQLAAVWVDKQLGTPLIQVAELASRPAIALPIICVALPIVAYLFRYTIHACEEAMTQEYVRTVQAKGLPRGRIFIKHVLRPATDSILAVLPKMVAIATSSLLIVERLYNILGVTAPFNGLGVRGAETAGMLATILIFLAALVFLFSIVASLLRLWVNPVLRK